MKLQAKMILFLSFLFIVAIGNASLNYLTDIHGEKKLEWVNHTHEVIIETEEFLSAMQNTETGQRGYLLTDNISYLEPYYRGVSNAEKKFKRMKHLTSDNSSQQALLKEINELTRKKFDELRITISLAEKHQKSKALEIVRQDKGKRYMDNIRIKVAEFISNERLLLEKRKGSYREYKARIGVVIILEIMFFVFLAILTISFLRRQLFIPLSMLLSSTQKMDLGEKMDVTNIVPRDEMGFLLTSFYKMNEKVYQRTQKLDYEAHHDKLTGLKNRSLLSHKISEGIAATSESNTKMAVLFIDLNKFKPLNDTLGHEAGDIVLKETALRLKKTLRSEDFVFRLGGDEFLVLIKGITKNSQARDIVANINKTFTKALEIRGKAVEISLSIGIAIAPDDSVDENEIIKFSDIAMYQAKRDDECNYAFFNKKMLKRSND